MLLLLLLSGIRKSKSEEKLETVTVRTEKNINGSLARTWEKETPKDLSHSWVVTRVASPPHQIVQALGCKLSVVAVIALVPRVRRPCFPSVSFFGFSL